MSRYIDADALREKWLCLQGHDFSPSSFVYSIDNAPTVDAVQVVRCNECKHHKDEEMGMVYCPHIVGSWVAEDFFCADGERKDGAE